MNDTTYRRAHKTWQVDDNGNKINVIEHKSINAAKRYCRNKVSVTLWHAKKDCHIPSKQYMYHAQHAS